MSSLFEFVDPNGPFSHRLKKGEKMENRGIRGQSKDAMITGDCFDLSIETYWFRRGDSQ